MTDILPHLRRLVSMFAKSADSFPELRPGLNAATALTKLYGRTFHAEPHPFVDLPASTTVAQIMQDSAAMIDRTPPKDPPHTATTLRPRTRKSSKVQIISTQVLTSMVGQFGVEDVSKVCSDLAVSRSDLNNAIHDLAKRKLIFRVSPGRYRIALPNAQPKAGPVLPLADKA